MSTVPGFPNAASVLPTDTLWITRGTGVDRDLEATVAQVGEAMVTPYRSQAVDMGKLASSADFVWLFRNSSTLVPVVGTVTFNRFVVEKIPPAVGCTKSAFRIHMSILASRYTGCSTDTDGVGVLINHTLFPWSADFLASLGARARTYPVTYISNTPAQAGTTGSVESAEVGGKSWVVFDLGMKWNALLPVNGTPSAGTEGHIDASFLIYPDDIPAPT